MVSRFCLALCPRTFGCITCSSEAALPKGSRNDIRRRRYGLHHHHQRVGHHTASSVIVQGYGQRKHWHMIAHAHPCGDSSVQRVACHVSHHPASTMRKPGSESDSCDRIVCPIAKTYAFVCRSRGWCYGLIYTRASYLIASSPAGLCWFLWHCSVRRPL